jgi:hypothetical protein
MGILKVVVIIFIIAVLIPAGLPSLSQQAIWNDVAQSLLMIDRTGTANSLLLVDKTGVNNSLLSIGSVSSPAYGSSIINMSELVSLAWVVIGFVILLLVFNKEA